MRIQVVTLFPEIFDAVTEYGVTGRAVRAGIVEVNYWNPRDFAHDRHRTVDDRSYGGGPGMVLKPEPIAAALGAARVAAGGQARTIHLSPQGGLLNHEKVMALSKLPCLILLCGRYEGIDERLIAAEIDEEISIGDYVLSGGELAAMVLIDALSRLLPGTLGMAESADQDSFAHGLLDHPHYTRPAVFQGQTVPEVLLQGDHAAIRRWRIEQSLSRTLHRRPDLLKAANLNQEQQAILNDYVAGRAEAAGVAPSVAEKTFSERAVGDR